MRNSVRSLFVHSSFFLYLATKNGVENCMRARKLPRTLMVNASLIKCPAPKHRYSSLLLDETTPTALDVCSMCALSLCVFVRQPYLFALWLILWLKSLEFWIWLEQAVAYHLEIRSEVALFVVQSGKFLKNLHLKLKLFSFIYYFQKYLLKFVYNMNFNLFASYFFNYRS